MSLFDEVNIRISHKISKRIGISKEAVNSFALARLIYELNLKELFTDASGIIEIIEKLNPAVIVKGIYGELLVINNLLDKILLMDIVEKDNIIHKESINKIIRDIEEKLKKMKHEL